MGAPKRKLVITIYDERTIESEKELDEYPPREIEVEIEYRIKPFIGSERVSKRLDGYRSTDLLTALEALNAASMDQVIRNESMSVTEAIATATKLLHSIMRKVLASAKKFNGVEVVNREELLNCIKDVAVEGHRDIVPSFEELPSLLDERVQDTSAVVGGQGFKVTQDMVDYLAQLGSKSPYKN